MTRGRKRRKKKQQGQYTPDKSYKKRKESYHYNSSFTNIVGSIKAFELVDVVFNHHKAVYDGDSFADIPQINNDKFDIEKIKKNINAKFYKEHYIENEIFWGRTSDDKRDKISLSSFLNLLKSFPEKDDQNIIYFITGMIGAGKTAFLNNIITTHAKQTFSKHNIIFIRASAYYLKRNIIKVAEDNYFSKLLYRLAWKTVDIVRKQKDVISNPAVKEAIDTLAFLIDDNKEEKVIWKHLKDCLETISNKNVGKKIVFIIDNVDYIFHVDDRLAFTKSNGKPPIPDIGALVDLFADPAKLGKLGLNIIMALRPDNYDTLYDISKTDNPYYQFNFDNHRHTFFLKSPELKEVIYGRIRLINDIGEKIKSGTTVAAVEIATPLTTFMEKSYKEDLLAILPKIGICGLRNILEFCKLYAWKRKKGAPGYEVGIDRFLKHFNAGLITFMLRGRKKFSSKYTLFPNIFISSKKLSQTFYWLKLLLLKYIDKQTKDDKTSPSIEIEHLLEIFTNGNNAYFKEVVLEALADMVIVEGDNLITGRLEYRNNKLCIKDIHLTQRGEACLHSIFENLSYLQLVTEDFELALPDIADIREGLFSTTDYSYLIDSNEEYSKHAIDMIKIKTEHVLLFLKILEYELGYEKQIFDDVYKKLSEKGVTVNIDKIRSDTENNIKGVLGYLGYSRAETFLETTKRDIEKYDVMLRNFYSE
jgi:predicted ATPase